MESILYTQFMTEENKTHARKSGKNEDLLVV